MTEPTYLNVMDAAIWWDKNKGAMRGKDGPEIYAAYANHVTAELQTKIDRLEIVNEDLRKTVCNTLNDYLENTEVKSLLNRIATLEAELAARDFVPISDVHRDGNGRILWDNRTDSHVIGSWEGGWWLTLDGSYHAEAFTHAAPLPQPPKEIKP